MKTKILKSLLIALSFVFVVSAYSQDTPQGEQKTVEELATVETVTMSELLDYSLTPEQMEKLMEINLDFHTKKKEAKERRASEQEFATLYQERDESMQPVLTEEQSRKWREGRRSRRK